MYQLRIANPTQNESIAWSTQALELGRGPQRECERLILQDAYVSRDQLRLEQQPSGSVLLVNLGRAPVQFADGTRIATDESCVVQAPIRLLFGQTTLDIYLPSAAPVAKTSDEGLATIQRPVSLGSSAVRSKVNIDNLRDASATDRLTQWFETLLTVQQAAAGSLAFYGETSKAIVDLIGLDRGMVLLLEGNKWRIAASSFSLEDTRVPYSERVVQKVFQDGRTFFQNLTADDGSHSLQGIDAVVASPVMNEKNQVIGIVYGSRDLRAATTKMGIDPLEAQLVQVLAGMVSVGLARVNKEAEATRMRLQFEQFFSPQLSNALEQDAELLSARERLLSLMFVDLRGFSKITEKIGPQETYFVLGEILEGFTSLVMDYDGVLIDYYGDGFAAMWNAPLDEPRHAELAAMAAMGIKRQMPSWNERLGKPLGVTLAAGIGVHTGIAHVGNSGSKRRLKYGPRGHAVNLTSRVEGATKLVGTSTLVTGATRQMLPPRFQFRRICQVRLYGMEEPVELFELMEGDNNSDWEQLRNQYEKALVALENGNALECLKGCATILAQRNELDGPTRWLLNQANQYIAAGRSGPNPTFTFDAKS